MGLDCSGCSSDGLPAVVLARPSSLDGDVVGDDRVVDALAYVDATIDSSVVNVAVVVVELPASGNVYFGVVVVVVVEGSAPTLDVAFVVIVAVVAVVIASTANGGGVFVDANADGCGGGPGGCPPLFFVLLRCKFKSSISPLSSCDCGGGGVGGAMISILGFCSSNRQ